MPVSNIKDPLNIMVKIKTLEEVFTKANSLVDGAIGLSALVAVAVLIYSAYLMITSAGDPEKYSSGTKGVVGAIIGLIIVAAAKMIVNFVFKTV
ncbi:hypothetical protein J6Z48_00365 [bacterium]|nr:hypothetical protein [bacterium]